MQVFSSLNIVHSDVFTVETKSKERFIVEIFFNVFIKYVFITK